MPLNSISGCCYQKEILFKLAFSQSALLFEVDFLDANCCVATDKTGTLELCKEIFMWLSSRILSNIQNTLYLGSKNIALMVFMNSNRIMYSG